MTRSSLTIGGKGGSMVNFTPNLSQLESSIDQQTGLRVSDFMDKSWPTIAMETNILQALNIICDNEVTGLIVVDRDMRVLGLVSEKDCLKYTLDLKYYNHGPGTVGDYMAKSLITIRPSDSLMYTAELFIKNHFQIYPVVEDGFLKGVVTRRMLVKEIQKMGQTSW